jgi:HEAT repeat protein
VQARREGILKSTSGLKGSLAMKTFGMIMLTSTLALGLKPPSDPGQRARAILGEAVKSKNPDVRKEAVIAFSLVGARDDILQTLDSMLDDHDVLVRLAVISTLGDFNDRGGVPLLEKALNDPTPEVGFAAGKALYRLHVPEGTQFLLSVASGESKTSSGYLAGQKRSAVRMLHTPKKLFLAAGKEVAGMVVPVPGLEVGLSSVQGILSDSGTASSAHAGALLMLAHENGPGVLEAIRLAGLDREWPVRAAAAHVIALHPYPELRDDLVPLLDDRKEAVRLRAAAAYLRLEPRAKRRPVNLGAIN